MILKSGHGELGVWILVLDFGHSARRLGQIVNSSIEGAIRCRAFCC